MFDEFASWIFLENEASNAFPLFSIFDIFRVIESV